ncbi:Sodium, potassium, lithium and rubidium/H(+) antiporter [compost metagenome]
MQSTATWSMVEAAFNGAIFLLLGLQLPSIIGSTLVAAGDSWWILVGYVVVISVALLLMRWVWLMLGVQRSLNQAHRQGKMAEKPSRLLILATTVAGIRGAVSLAAALSVPLLLPSGQAFPSRDLLIFLATGTILFTLILASIALPWILRHMPPAAEPVTVREERLARVAASQAALDSLRLTEEQAQPRDANWLAQRQEVVGHLTQEYRNRLNLLDDDSTSASSVEAQSESPELVLQRKLRYVMEMDMRINCLQREREVLYAERQAHRINDESLRSLVNELDLSEVALRKRLAVARRAAGLPLTDGEAVTGHSAH